MISKIKNINFAFFTLILFISNIAEAQIGIGTDSPHPSAILQIQDTTKGLLIPKMSLSQKNAILNPAEGLLLYQTDNEKGFWYFSNGQWRNLSVLNNGGKHTIYLADNITNSEAIAKIAVEAGPNTQEVKIIRCSKLTTVDLSMLTALTNIYISGDTVLQSINLDNLQSIDGGFLIDKCPVLSTIQTSRLQKIGLDFNGNYSLQITNTGLLALSLPLLSQIIGKININNNINLVSIDCPQMTEHIYAASPTDPSFPFTITTNNSLSSLSFPLLSKAGSFSINNNANLASLNFNSLTNVQSFSVSGTNVLVTASFPSLTSTGYFYINSNSSLTTFNAPLLTTATIISVQVNSSLNAFSLPGMQTTESLYITNNPSLSSLSFPNLTGLTSLVSNTLINTNLNLLSVDFNSLTTMNNDMFTVAGGKLPSAQINYLLNKLVSITPSLRYRTIDLRQLVPAPPIGQGIIDKATLVARPNTVYTD